MSGHSRAREYRASHLRWPPAREPRLLFDQSPKVLMRRPHAIALKTGPPVIARIFQELGPIQGSSLILSYLGLTPFRPLNITLRNGQVLAATTRNDLATIVGVFFRQDYGRVPSGSVVVDVGANVGFFTLWALCCGAKQVLAVEPDDANFSRLLKAVGSHEGVDARRVAVADSPGRRALALHESTSNSLVIELYPDAPRRVVECVTLDSVLTSLDEIDLLKIDIEGAEYEALFASALTAVEVKSVRLEYHVVSPTKTSESLVNFLISRGYRVVRRVEFSRNSGMLWVER